jgi:pimeloyl-ACP methyl ester carboxylesterase
MAPATTGAAYATDGTRLAFEHTGTGPWLLLVNGIGAPRQTWAAQVTGLRDRFRCLTVDNRGVGASGRPAGPYTTASCADDLVSVLDAAGAERVHVLGASMGGAIAQELALRHPDRVAKLVLASTWAHCDTRLRAVFGQLRALAAVSGEAPVSLVTDELTLLGYGLSSWRTQTALVTAPAEPSTQPGRCFVAQADACLAHDTRDRLSALRAPVLLVAGSEDLFVAPEHSRQIADALPHTELEIFADCGHVMFYEAPQRFNELVTRFLTQGAT